VTESAPAGLGRHADAGSFSWAPREGYARAVLDGVLTTPGHVLAPHGASPGSYLYGVGAALGAVAVAALALIRDGERRLVARLVEGEIRVIATGGGAFVDANTRRLLNERAITVWLDAPVDILAERTARRDTRPLLRNSDPKAVLQKLAEERRPSYAEAHIHVKSGGGAHQEVVEAIVSALEAYLDQA